MEVDVGVVGARIIENEIIHIAAGTLSPPEWPVLLSKIIHTTP
jgi:hypothetical protein